MHGCKRCGSRAGHEPREKAAGWDGELVRKPLVSIKRQRRGRRVSCPPRRRAPMPATVRACRTRERRAAHLLAGFARADDRVGEEPVGSEVVGADAVARRVHRGGVLDQVDPSDIPPPSGRDLRLSYFRRQRHPRFDPRPKEVESCRICIGGAVSAGDEMRSSPSQSASWWRERCQLSSTQGFADAASSPTAAVARCRQADPRAGERPAGRDDLAREGRADGPATRRRR